MKKFLRNTAAGLCAVIMLLSVGCGNDTEVDGNASSNGTSALSQSISDTSSVSTKDETKAESNEAVTTEYFSTPVALEPEDLKVNIVDSVPVEYHTTLIDYKAMVETLVNDNMVDNEDGTFSSAYYPYPMMAYSLTEIKPKIKKPTFGMFGYAIRDINSDGSPELILMCDNQALIEIYTIFNGEVKLATFFWPGFNGVITADGKLYTETLNSSLNMDMYAIETLGTDTGYFSAIRRLGRTIADDPADVHYVELKGEDEFSVTKIEFHDFVSSFPTIPKFGEAVSTPSDILEFIPIAIG